MFTWMGSSSSHWPDTSRSPYSPMHQDATCTRGCCRQTEISTFARRKRTCAGSVDDFTFKRWFHLRDVVQQGFVESLYGVSVHLHTVGDELDEVRDGVVSDVTPRLQRPNRTLTNRIGKKKKNHKNKNWRFFFSFFFFFMWADRSCRQS